METTAYYFESEIDYEKSGSKYTTTINLFPIIYKLLHELLIRYSKVKEQNLLGVEQ